jgi:hypothetical protein
MTSPKDFKPWQSFLQTLRPCDGKYTKHNRRCFPELTPTPLVGFLQIRSLYLLPSFLSTGWGLGTEWGATPSCTSLCQKLASLLGCHFLSLLHEVSFPSIVLIDHEHFSDEKNLLKKWFIKRVSVSWLHLTTFKAASSPFVAWWSYMYIHQSFIRDKYCSLFFFFPFFFPIFQTLGIFLGKFSYFIYWKDHIYLYLKYYYAFYIENDIHAYGFVLQFHLIHWFIY